MTISPPPTRAPGTHRGAICATLLTALLALIVLLQVIPAMSGHGSDAAAAATSTGLDPLAASLLPVFIVGTSLILLAVTAILVGRARRRVT